MGILLRQYWYLVVVLGLCTAVVAAGLMRRNDDATAPQSTADKQAAAKDADLRQRLDTAPTAPRKTVAEEAQTIIDRHEATLAENPDSEDTPAVLSALGNLYLQRLKDYESAAQQYERVILEFPDWTGTHGIYIQLATCYELLDDQAQAQWVYKQMRKVFPEESQEHQFALEKLGLR